MSALIAFSFLAAAAELPSGADQAQAAAPSERKLCTRIEHRSGSRMGHRRVCLTAREWRDRLGPDWRQSVAGATPEDDYETVDTRSRVHSTLPTTGLGGRGRPDI